MRDGADVIAKLFRGLGDTSRLRVLACLRDGPLTVGAIVERTRLSQPNASMHLACLADCGLVTREQRGRFVHYEIADKRVVRLLDDAEELLLHAGSLVGACPRYRGPARRVTGRSRPPRGGGR
jgi:DNA-binding transcriptional ArsR family regulator